MTLVNTVEAVWARVDGAADQAEELLRREVARHRGIDPSLVTTARLCPACGSPRHGRPIATLPRGVAPVQVSLSRSLDVVAVAFTGEGAIGIDVERADVPTFTGFDGVVLHPNEKTATVRDRAVVWARKESLLKATGDGLDVDPSTIELSGADEHPALLAWTSPRPRPAHVQMTDVQIDPRHVAAVTVLSATNPQVRVREEVRGASAG